jgi:hypothetical protein
MSSDGVPLDFDAVIRLQVTDSVRLIANFGEKWFESNVGAVRPARGQAGGQVSRLGVDGAEAPS